ncbi:MAG TPA: DUF4262 domain-containing protein [Acidimicrobiia bacterium]|nr:DUF4262 domain-containing protein [Acidimicrobiia bacterium]
MDARTQAWLDQWDAMVTEKIRTHGWFIQYVFDGECFHPGCDGGDSGEPPFAYTVGLFGLDHPELLIFGLPPETASGVLNTLGGRIRNGEDLIPGQLITFESWPHRIIPEVVPNPGEIVLEANRFYQRPDEASVPVLQLSYDDLRGRFPWEEGYSAPTMQPRPGTFRA